METLRQRIGKIIRERRIAAGFKRQGVFAEALGCDQPRVSNWESGKEMPDTAYREKLKTLLGMTDSDFEPAIIRDNGEVNIEAAVERATEKVLAERLSQPHGPSPYDVLPKDILEALLAIHHGNGAFDAVRAILGLSQDAGAAQRDDTRIAHETETNLKKRAGR